MGAYYDIYAFIKKRDKILIDKFLHQYSQRREIELEDSYEIMVLKNAKYKVEEVWETVNSIEELITYGLKNPNYGFTFYSSHKGLKNDIKSVIIRFTYDAALIFGLSIEESDNQGNDNYPRAVELADELKILFSAEACSVQYENPPADDEAEFYAEAKNWKIYIKD